MLYIALETLSAFALTYIVIELTPRSNLAYLRVMMPPQRAALRCRLSIDKRTATGRRCKCWPSSLRMSLQLG